MCCGTKKNAPQCPSNVPSGRIFVLFVRGNFKAEGCQVVSVIAGVVIHVAKGVCILQRSCPKGDAPPLLAWCFLGPGVACLLALCLSEILRALHIFVCYTMLSRKPANRQYDRERHRMSWHMRIEAGVAL